METVDHHHADVNASPIARAAGMDDQPWSSPRMAHVDRSRKSRALREVNQARASLYAVAR
jgi:hypothetical protein